MGTADSAAHAVTASSDVFGGCSVNERLLSELESQHSVEGAHDICTARW